MFIYELSAKFFSLFMSAVLFFNTLGFNLNLKSVGNEVELTYTFSNSLARSAAGEIEIEAKRDGTYTIYWANENEKPLSIEVSGYECTYSYLCKVEVEDGKGETEVYSFTAIPDGAAGILAYRGALMEAYTALPENKNPSNDEKIYSFGALSDVHFNRYSLSLTDDSMNAFPNALNFLDAMGVDFVAMSGDLSSSSETNAYEKFNYIASKYDFPVYTCTGNHDCKSYMDRDAWRSLINTGVYGSEESEQLPYINNDTLDFVYVPENGKGDVFIFLSQQYWDYNNYPDDDEEGESRIVTDEQLDRLEETLESYKDRTVYLFFHTFFANLDTNDAKTGEGNLVNPGGEYYDLTYTVGTADETRFRQLLIKYKNVITFNGHSHWAFDMIKYNPITNITDYDGKSATFVHISSVASPRRVTDNATDRTEYYMRDSEGYLVTVYDDYVLLQGVGFLKGQMLSYATYMINR